MGVAWKYSVMAAYFRVSNEYQMDMKENACVGGGGKMNISFDVIAMHAAEEFIWSSRLNIGIPQVANMQCHLFFFVFFQPNKSF